MKPLNCPLLIVSLILLAGCQKKEVPAELKERLDSIASAMVPQHAESVCDVSLILSENGVLTVKGETDLPEAKSAIIEMLDASGRVYADSITVMPDPVVVDKPWGLISVSVCNIRSRPAHSAEMATQALMGTPVKILDKRGGWHLVQMPDSYIGWVRNTIIELTDDEMIAWRGSERVIFLGHTGVITDIQGETVSDITFGAILVIKGSRGDRWAVILPDGRTGEVKKSEAADLEVWASRVDIEPQRLIRFAKSFMGTPYLWGGTSTKGVDCSGYTKNIYYFGGVIMTRDASGQFRYGDEVSIENPNKSLAPGDLLYFGSERDGRKNITHTGLYIGDNEFIHATAGPGMVIVSSFDSARTNYSSNLLESLQGARRVTGFTEGKGLQRVAQHSWYF